MQCFSQVLPGWLDWLRMGRLGQLHRQSVEGLRERAGRSLDSGEDEDALDFVWLLSHEGLAESRSFKELFSAFRSQYRSLL